MIAPYTFVFVSHVSEDSAAATAMVANLEARGIVCWIAPRDVNPGRPFDTEIAEAIETCRVMLLLFSERCNESEYIRREVTVAGEVGKVIIPYRIEEARPKGALRVRLSDLHWIDAFEAPDRAFDELVCTMLPDGERCGTRFPVASQLTTSTSVILPETVPAPEVAPAAQSSAPLASQVSPANTELVFDYSSLAAGGPMQGTPAHVSADGTVEWIEQLRRRRDPPTGRYLARPARAARRVLSRRVLLEWLGRRPIHAAGIVSVIALSVLTPVGIYTLAPNSISSSPEQLAAATGQAGVSRTASGPQRETLVPRSDPPAMSESGGSKLATAGIVTASAAESGESGGFKLAAAGLVTAVMTKVSDFPAPVAQAQAGPIRKPAFLAKLFGGGEEADEETVAAPAPTRTAVPAKSVRGGWMIQVGAYPAEHDAKQRLDAVQSKASKLLGSAHPFTDTVDKGGTIYYRARFAGLDQDKAEAACQYLKSDGVDCIMIKN